jgi:hypothetical protein
LKEEGKQKTEKIISGNFKPLLNFQSYCYSIEDGIGESLLKKAPVAVLDLRLLWLA